MATPLSYKSAKNSTPPRTKTPKPIKIKFGTADYIHKIQTTHVSRYDTLEKSVLRQWTFCFSWTKA